MKWRSRFWRCNRLWVAGRLSALGAGLTAGIGSILGFVVTGDSWVSAAVAGTMFGCLVGFVVRGVLRRNP